MIHSDIVLVTGGAGFIGANLIRRLIQDGYTHIHAMVEPESTQWWRLSDLVDYITLHPVDITNAQEVDAAIEKIKPTKIFHLAGYGQNAHQSVAKAMYDINFLGTINVLESCKKVGFDAFVNVGTHAEYGLCHKPIKEEHALQPLCDYGVSKAAATQYCLKEALYNKYPVYTVRPFKVYGDFELASRTLPQVILAALTRKPVYLASANNAADYIYIQDVIELLLRVAHKKPHDAYIFNAGTGSQYSNQNIVDTVSKIVESKVDVVWGNEHEMHWQPRMWHADTSTTEHILGYKTRFNLDAGLNATVSWFKKNIETYEQGIASDILSKKLLQYHSVSL